MSYLERKYQTEIALNIGDNTYLISAVHSMTFFPHQMESGFDLPPEAYLI